MRFRWALVLFVVLAALALSSCERLNPEQDTTGLVPLQGVPLEYGNLVSVTMAAEYPGWAQLWFQDSAGTIRMVRMHWISKKMAEQTMTIPRTAAAAGGN